MPMHAQGTALPLGTLAERGAAIDGCGHGTQAWLEILGPAVDLLPLLIGLAYRYG